MPSPYIVEFDLSLTETLESVLQERGFSFSHPPHTRFQAKGQGVNVTLYNSGKLVVQGRDMQEFIEYTLEPEVLKSFSYKYEHIDVKPHIGVDESGKGDFFGPLVVAGVYASQEQIEALKKIGVKDSKKLKDAAISKMAYQIKKVCPHAVLTLRPEKYNELYTNFGNLNQLLGWGHATIIEKLVKESGCHEVIIDKFASEHVVETALRKKGVSIQLTQITQGERDLIVAAASIIARSTFVYAMEDLSKEWGLKFPKGVSSKTHQIGREFVQKHGAPLLGKVSKLHFKTAQEVQS
jgi:ribonuclease HIII